MERKTRKILALTVALMMCLVNMLPVSAVEISPKEEIKGKDAAVLPIGKKSVDFFRSRKIPMLTEEYAAKIGADAYGKDAMETVRWAEKIV